MLGEEARGRAPSIERPEKDPSPTGGGEPSPRRVYVLNLLGLVGTDQPCLLCVERRPTEHFRRTHARRGDDPVAPDVETRGALVVLPPPELAPTGNRPC